MGRRTLGKPDIEITADTVVILGVTIKRPDSIAPSQWMHFWEQCAEKDTRPLCNCNR